MEIVYAILLEIIFTLAIGIPATYLIWKLGRKKLTLRGFVSTYGQAIGSISVILSACVIGVLYNLFFRD